MTELDQELSGLSYELIEEYGKSVFYQIENNPTYNPATSKTETSNPDAFEIKAIVEVVESGASFNGSLLEGGDIKLYIAPEYFENYKPTPTDTFILDDRMFTVPDKGVIPYYSGELIALYAIVGRN